VYNSNHYQQSSSQQGGNPSQEENKNCNPETFISQGDAIYDYERVPARWMGFDEQRNNFSWEDVVEVENGDRN